MNKAKTATEQVRNDAAANGGSLELVELDLASNELQKVLDSPHSGMVFVESVMDKYDAPIDLIFGGHALADSDYGVPGPQAAANAQIPFPTQHSERNADASAHLKPVSV